MKSMASWCETDGGFFMGVKLDEKLKTDNLLERAGKANLMLTDGCNFFTDGSGRNFVRLPFCSLTPDEIEEGITRLAGVVNSQ